MSSQPFGEGMLWSARYESNLRRKPTKKSRPYGYMSIRPFSFWAHLTHTFPQYGGRLQRQQNRFLYITEHAARNSGTAHTSAPNHASPNTHPRLGC